jgi:small subunit ribosomal protein S5
VAEKNKEKNELIEKVVRVNRVAKVVKGGRRFSLGKANEVVEAIRKAVGQASVNMKKICVEGTSIPHVAIGRFGAGKVIMKPADKGHGIIAAGAVRAVMEAAGIMDISVKCLGSRNPNNLVRSTLDGLYNLRSNEWIAKARNKDIDYLKQ